MKQQYRIRNWSEYNAALRQRGSLTFWVSEEALGQWLNTEPSEQLGAPKTYSDIAIMSVVTLKSLFQLAGRQASGFLASLFEPIEGDIEQVSGDGAYDTTECYDTITDRGAKPAIPPRKNAVIRHHGNRKAVPHPRDEALRSIRKHGRKQWKQDSRYHRRSLAETAMFRHKTAFGGKVRSRKFENQATELLCQCAMLNRMIQLGKPISVPIPA
jgi:hypothetical protein